MKVVVLPSGGKNASVLGIKGLRLGDLLGATADWAFRIEDIQNAWEMFRGKDGHDPEEAALLTLADLRGVSVDQLKAQLNFKGNDASEYIRALAEEFEGTGIDNVEEANRAFDAADLASKSPSMNLLMWGGIALVALMLLGKRRLF